MNKKVSVVVPLFNSISFIKEALDSIYNQTYNNLQVILVDDYSTDNTFDYVQQIIPSGNNTVLLKNKYQKGIVGADNTALSIADGDYIAFCDHDDISVIDRFDMQVKLFEAYPEIGACGGWMKEFGFGNNIWKYKKSHNEIQSSLIFHTPIPSPTAMIRTSIVQKYNLKFDNEYELAEDYKFWLDATKCTTLHNIQEVLINYRTHTNNTYSKYKEEKYISWKKALKDYLRAWQSFPFYEDDDFYRTIFEMKQSSVFKNKFIENKALYLKHLEGILTANDSIPIFDQMILQNIIDEKINYWEK